MRRKTWWRGAAVAALAVVVLPGCDFLDMFSQKQSRGQAVLREAEGDDASAQPDRRSQDQAKSQRALLLHHVESRLGMLKSAVAAAAKEEEELRADRMKLSASLSELTDKFAGNKAMSPAEALSITLKDGCVNEIALKYLGEDFALIRGEYEEKMRELERLEKEMNDVKRRNMAEYEEALSSFDSSARQKRDRNEAALTRIKKEISEKERQLRRLRANPPPTGHVYDRARAEHSRSTQMLERRISQLQDEMRRIEGNMRTDDSARKREQVRLSALRDRRNADATTAKNRGKGAMTMDKIMADCRARSLAMLETELKNRADSARSRKELAESRIVFLENSTNGIDRLDVHGLKAVRNEIDQELAKGGSKSGNGNGGKGRTDRP